mgnify:CR=1 FL=1
MWDIRGRYEADFIDQAYKIKLQIFADNGTPTTAEFVLDDHHVFPKGVSIEVCSNTANMLSATRFNKYFEISKLLFNQTSK